MEPQQDPITNPSNTIIVFDLHHVLVKPNYSSMVLEALCDSALFAKFFLLCDPFFTLPAAWELLRGGHLEEVLLKRTPTYGREMEELYRFATRICNCQDLRVNMFNLVRSWKEKGFKVFIFSNISHNWMEDLKLQHPDFFSLFDVIHTSGPSCSYLQKPSRAAFEHFLKEHVPDDMQVIFIDDSPKNIEMAKDLGLFGLRFHSTALTQQGLEQLCVLSDP
eukprot:TRINITY_DN6421_c0_g1_i1.p1 TRINITY_DN6421_c0_g1~~TRINITY_DN6421_c0_g1_i1.p1  ORF type:complete len:220 (+),score=40.90 TRINITY_DN6421_c0_g1_i1:39-698(+)